MALASLCQSNEQGRRSGEVVILRVCAGGMRPIYIYIYIYIYTEYIFYPNYIRVCAGGMRCRQVHTALASHGTLTVTSLNLIVQGFLELAIYIYIM